MENNRNSFEGGNQQTTEQPNESGNQQTYGQPNEFNSQQTYGQSNEFNSQQTYGQPNEFNSQQTYGQPNEFNSQQTYGQSNEFNSQQTYGQQNYGGQPFSGNYGMEKMPLDKNGQPVKNRFGMKIIFSVLEILSLIFCNVITCILGIIACVFTARANNSYKEGRWENFKSEARTSAVLLWVGFGMFLFEVIVIIISMVMGYSMLAQINRYAGNANSGNGDNPYYNNQRSFAGRETGEEDTQTQIPITPSNVTEGEGFIDPSFTLNGAAITLPLNYAELAALGFKIDADDEEYVVNKNEYYYPDLYDANGNEIGYVYIANMTDAPIAMKEGLVFGFVLSNEDYMDAIADIVFENGVTFASTKEELLTAFGEPDYTYESENYDSFDFTWYHHSDEYYDSAENSIEFSFWDGVIDEITIRYIGWD